MIDMTQTNPSDRANWSRHEIKYLVSESTAQGIVDYIRPLMWLDRFSEFQQDYAYPIVSLYFDSDRLRLYQETAQGIKDRFKLRIRRYSDDPEFPSFFEIKHRINRTVYKSRGRVMAKSVPSLIEGKTRPPSDDNRESKNVAQFLLLTTRVRARPIVRTRYRRQAFESYADKNVRLTFDREFCFAVTQNLDTSLEGPGWHRLPLSNGVILEIKFNGRFPAWMSRMVRYFQCDQKSISKYGLSIEGSHLLKFCSPQFSRGLF